MRNAIRRSRHTLDRAHTKRDLNDRIAEENYWETFTPRQKAT